MQFGQAMVWCVWVLALAAGPGERPTVLHVRDFGAAGDGRADDGPAIRRALARAVAHGGPACVRLDARTYRVARQDASWANFILRDAAHVTVDGAGALLLLHPSNRAFTLDRCRRCVIRDLRIDYDPLPFTQGRVTRVAAEARTFDLRLDPGFPDPPDQGWMTANYGVHGGWRHGCVLDPETRTFAKHIQGGFLRPERVDVLDRAARAYRVRVFDAPAKLTRLRVRDRFVMRVRYATAERNRALPDLPVASIRIVRSADCRLERVRLYCSPNMSIHLYENQGRVTIDGCRIQYRPDDPRLVTSLSDGIHCKSNRAGPVIRNCLFEGLMDDSINISRMVDFVEAVLSPTVLRCRCSSIAWFVDSMAPGDELLAFDARRGRVLGTARVARVTDRSGHRRTIHLDRPIPDVYGQKTAQDRKCVWLMNQTASGHGYVIRNNTFRRQMRSAMLLRASGLVEGNHVDDVGGLGVYHTNGLRFTEGPIPNGTIIRGNTIVNCRHHPAIAVGSASFNPAMAPLARGVRIEGNQLHVAADYPAIRTSFATGCRIRDNAITIRPGQKAVELRACGAIDMTGNTVRHAADAAKGDGPECKSTDPR